MIRILRSSLLKAHVLAALTLSLFVAACSDVFETNDEQVNQLGGKRGDDDDSNTKAPDAAIAEDSPSELYLVGNIVFTPDDQTLYVSPQTSLTVDEIKTEASIEFPGWADMWVYGEHVFVSSGDAPELTKYSVDKKNQLVVDGSALSFASYGAGGAAFWNQLFISETKAYYFNTGEREVIVWDPSEMAIVKTFAMPELPDRKGDMMLAGPTADRSSVIRGNRAFVPFYWANWGDGAVSEDSVLLTIDTDTDEVIAETNIDCPEINFVTTDDEGTIYFSNWGYSVIPTLVDDKAPACAVRIQNGQEDVDPDYKLYFAELTEGREGANLRYIGDGKALLTVFHDERIDFEQEEDPYILTDSANWKLWLVDMQQETAHELTGLGWHAAGLNGKRIDGEYFLSLPSADYSSSETFVVASDGTAEKRFDSSGWLTRLFRVR